MTKLPIMICILILMSNNAFGFCSSPDAPDPPSTYSKPTKPTVPFCVNEFTRTHTCDDWQISSYNSELENYRSEVEYYVQKLKNYVSEAQSFAHDSVEYAKCEIRNLD